MQTHARSHDCEKSHSAKDRYERSCHYHFSRDTNWSWSLPSKSDLPNLSVTTDWHQLILWVSVFLTKLLWHFQVFVLYLYSISFLRYFPESNPSKVSSIMRICLVNRSTGKGKVWIAITQILQKNLKFPKVSSKNPVQVLWFSILQS